jgi:hypothetical protein
MTEGSECSRRRALADAPLPPGQEQPYLDIVDFVERTTYAIWNDRQPKLVEKWYGPRSVIRSDSGDLVGGDIVTAATRERMRTFPDYLGMIHDTIWTGDDASGYRTSMRWTARGVPRAAGQGQPGPRRAQQRHRQLRGAARPVRRGVGR